MEGVLERTDTLKSIVHNSFAAFEFLNGVGVGDALRRLFRCFDNPLSLRINPMVL